MGRRNKKGLDYFPIDVDMFEDSKVALLNAEFGTKGESILLRILCKVYRNGYYMNYNNDEALLIAKSVGKEVTGSLVDEVVNGLIRRSFFDKGVFDSFNILTSKGIQDRYLEASSRRKTVDIRGDILLIDINAYKNAINVNINGKNVDINTQSRVEESRVKESRVDNDSAPPILSDIGTYKNECLEDEMRFVAPLIQKYGHKGLTTDNIISYLEAFNNHLEMIRADAKTRQDYRSHFINWLPKNLKDKASEDESGLSEASSALKRAMQKT